MDGLSANQVPPTGLSVSVAAQNGTEMVPGANHLHARSYFWHVSLWWHRVFHCCVGEFSVFVRIDFDPTNTLCVSTKAAGSAPSAWNDGGSICFFACSLLVGFGKSLQITLHIIMHVLSLDAGRLS